MLVQVLTVFVGASVSDLATSQRWYEQLFGRSPDVVVNAREVMWRLNDGAWLFIVQDDSTGRNAHLLVAIDDLDRELADLAERGIRPRELELLEGAGRKAHFDDPDGNQVVLAELFEH